MYYVLLLLLLLLLLRSHAHADVQVHPAAGWQGVRISVNVLRNLAMPTANRPLLTAVDGGAIFFALLAHVGHRDPNTAALVGACLRLLVEGE